jgi:hypothetical protein
MRVLTRFAFVEIAPTLNSLSSANVSFDRRAISSALVFGELYRQLSRNPTSVVETPDHKADIDRLP